MPRLIKKKGELFDKVKMESKEKLIDGILAWSYEDQTKMKHKAFKDYFDAWTSIIGNSFKALNYIDCFGGCGAYYNHKGEVSFGSPILAAKIFEDKPFLKDKFGFIVIDKNKKNLDNIKKIFEKEKISFSPNLVNGDFEEVINGKLLNSNKNIAPTFFFVDPFGIKINMSTLHKMMTGVKKSEILLNFMYNGVNRNINVPQSEQVLTELYGSEEWKDCITEEEKVECFRKKLKEVAKFVIAYKINFPDQNRTYYYLFHLCNHIKGASIMKGCFAKFNHGKIEYLGKLGNQLSLWDIKEFKLEEIKKYLEDNFRNSSLDLLELKEKLIDSTPYLEKNIMDAIRDLEKENKIAIKRNPPLTPTGKNRISIQEQDTVIFNNFI